MALRWRLLLLLLPALLAAAVNQAPTLDPIPPVTLAEDAGAYAVLLTGIGPGAGDGGQGLAVSATWSNLSPVSDVTVAYASPATTAVVTLYLAQDLNGPAAVEITVQDDGGTAGGGVDRIARRLDVQVEPVNDPPTWFYSPASATRIAEGGTATILLTGIWPGGVGEADRGLALVASSAAPDDLAVTSAVLSDDHLTAAIGLRSLGHRRGTSVDVLISLIDPAPPEEGGTAVETRVQAIAVINAEDPPVVQAAGALPVAAGGTAILTPAVLAVSDADGDAVAFSLVLPPAHGALRLDGTDLASGGAFTQEDIDAGRVTYRHAGAAAADGFTVTCGDGVLPALGPLAVGVVVDGLDQPQVVLSGPAAAWREGDAAVAPAPAAAIRDLAIDAGTGAYAGGSLAFAIGAGGRPGDSLTLASGSGATAISLAGSQVLYGGQPVAQWSGGIGGEALRVVFAFGDPALSAAYRAAPAAVIRALRFANPGDDPGSSARSIAIALDPGDGRSALPVAATVLVTPVDDPPVLATPRIATPAGLVREVALSAGDPDSAAITWSLAGSASKAAVSLADPAAGIFRIAPAAGQRGLDAFTVGMLAPPATAPVLATVALMISDADDPRPQAAGEFPCAAHAGDALAAVIPFDAVDLGGDPRLVFALAADAPAGCAVAALDARTALLTWTVPADAAAGVHHRFHLVAADQAGAGAGILPVSVLVLPRPAGVR